MAVSCPVVQVYLQAEKDAKSAAAAAAAAAAADAAEEEEGEDGAGAAGGPVISRRYTIAPKPRPPHVKTARTPLIKTVFELSRPYYVH